MGELALDGEGSPFLLSLKSDLSNKYLNVFIC